MTSMRFLLVAWLSGIVAGVVLMERWRRHGGQYVPVDSIEASVDTTTPGTASPASNRRPNVVGLVVTGAKLDAERVRRRLRPVDASQPA